MGILTYIAKLIARIKNGIVSYKLSKQCDNSAWSRIYYDSAYESKPSVAFQGKWICAIGNARANSLYSHKGNVWGLLKDNSHIETIEPKEGDKNWIKL